MNTNRNISTNITLGTTVILGTRAELGAALVGFTLLVAGGARTKGETSGHHQASSEEYGASSK